MIKIHSTMWLQKINIFTFKNIFKLTNKISTNVKDILLMVSIIFIVLLVSKHMIRGIIKVPIILNLTDVQCGILFSFLLLIITIASVDRPLQKVSWNTWMVSLYVIFGLLLLIVPCFHFVGFSYRILAVLMIVGFPCYYFVWINRGDYEKMFAFLAWVIAVVGTIVIIANLLSIHYFEGAIVNGMFYGLPGHYNSIGLHGSTTLIGALYLVAVAPKKYKWIPSIVIVLSITFVIMSASRAAFLSMLVQFIVFIIYIVKNNLKLSKDLSRIKKYKRISILVAVIVTAILIFTVVSTTVSGSDTNAGSTDYIHRLIDRFIPPEGATVDQYSSSRIAVWKEYISYFNLFGNDIREGLSSGKLQMYSAHNLPIEFAYRAGVPAGIVFMLIELWALVWVIWCLIRRGTMRKSSLFACLAIVAFFVESMLEVIVLPYRWSLTAIFFLSLAPVFERRRKGISRN